MEELKFSKKLSFGLFTVGTIIMVAFAVTLFANVALIGYIYTGFAFSLGMIYLTVLIWRVARKKIDFNTGIKSICIVSINIPIAAFYLYLVLLLMNCARLTFENKTGQNLDLIQVLGCEEKKIMNLGSGESTMIWINIPNDCSIEIEYEINGVVKREIVAGYITNFNGVIATYKIGSNKDIFL